MDDNNTRLYNLEDKDIKYDDAVSDGAPLYNLDDNEKVTAEESLSHLSEEDLPYAFGQEDPDADAEAEESGDVRHTNPVVMMFKIMFSPVTGWKDLKRSKLSPERVGRGLFYPLIGLAAVSVFLRVIYEAVPEVTHLVTSAIVMFISFIFSYFILPVVGRPFLSDSVNAVLRTDFGKNVLMVLFSTLALFEIIYCIVPSLEPVIVFLPLWTIYITSRVTNLLKAPRNKQEFTGAVLSILIVGLPAAFTWLLEKMLP